MIDELAALIEKHWATFGIQRPYERNGISVTKFCQRVVQPHTKVLFFVTFCGAPLCILKTVRTSHHNENLLREAKHQAAAPHTAVLSAPKVFWTDAVLGRAVYAEEYIDALPVTLREYQSLLPEVTAFSQALQRFGTVRSDEFADSIASYLPDDPVIQRHLATLRDLKAPLTLGFTHGDMGRQNILGTWQRAWIIDWERAGDVPAYAFDVIDVQLKLNKYAVPEDKLLYAVRSIYAALFRRFPDVYRRVAELGRSMVGST